MSYTVASSFTFLWYLNLISYLSRDFTVVESAVLFDPTTEIVTPKSELQPSRPLNLCDDGYLQTAG